MTRLLSEYGGLLRNLWPISRALAQSARVSLRGAESARITATPADVPELWVPSGRDSRVGVMSYLEVTDAEDLAVGSLEILPPLYFLTGMIRPYVELITCRTLGLSLFGILHVQNDLIIHRPLYRRESFVCRVLVERIHSDDQRSLVTVRGDTLVQGKLTSEMRTLLLTGNPASAGEAAATASPSGDGEWQTVRSVRFPERLGLRYAGLTGDVNPIHLHPVTSRPFGFPRPIAHGFCVKAVIAHALIRELGGGAMESLRRLRLRFRAPIPLPSAGLVQVWKNQVRLVDRRGLLLASGRFGVRR
ncbi:MAG: MaoC/PaaZ C-terminal domain-containing protein [bacterium]